MKEPGYKNSLHHLREELQRLDLLIFRQIREFRGQRGEDVPEAYKGLFISEGEIDGILNRDRRPGDETDPLFGGRLEAFNASIARNAAASLEKGVYLSLVHLSHIFRLSSFDINCVLICLAPHLDLKYERLYAYLQNDITRKSPSVNLIMKLLCRTLEEETSARIFFAAHSPLFKYRLLEYIDGGESGKTALLSRSLKLDERIAGFLLESTVMDPRLIPFTRITAPASESDDLPIPGENGEKIETLARLLAHRKEGEGFVFCLQGPPDNGQKQAAGDICRKSGYYLLEVDMGTVGTDGFRLDFDMFMDLLFREAVLQSAALYFKGCDFLEDTRKNFYNNRFLHAVGVFGGIVCIETEQNLTARFRASGDSNSHFFSLQFPIPSYRIRKKLWDRHLNGTPLPGGVDTLSLAGKFRFPGGRIRDAVNIARDMALLKKSPGSLSAEDIHSACRSVSNQKLGPLPGKSSPGITGGISSSRTRISAV